MKQIEKGEYISPNTVIYGIYSEGVLCQSGDAGHEGSTNEGYSSGDDLFEIF